MSLSTAKLPPNLSETLILLLESLGLYSQAENVKEGQSSEKVDAIMLVELLSKFNLKFSVLPISDADLQKAIYPFIVFDESNDSYILRRQSHRFEKQIVGQDWLDFDISTLNQDDYVITIDSIPSTRKKGSSFSTLLAKRKKWFRPVFLLSLFSSLTGLAIPLFTMAVYDRVIGGQSANILPGIALGAVIAVAILVGSRLVRAKILTEQSNRLAREMSGMTFSKLINLPLIILSRVGLASHIYRLRNAEKIRTLLSGHGGAGLIDLPFTLIIFITIILISGWLVLVPIGMLLLSYIILMLLDKYVQAAMPTISIEYQEALNEFSKSTSHLKNSGFNELWVTKFFKLSKENTRQNFIYAKRNGLNASVSQGLSMLTTLATVFAGIFLVLDQSISPGALIACVMLIGRVTGPAQLAFMSRHKLAMMKMATTQFDRFMETETELSETRLKIIDKSKPPTLSFSQVSLRYSAITEPALSGVSVDIAAGEVIAVIGPSGSGKSSFLATALSLAEPVSGVVLLNGINIKQYEPAALREFIGYSGSSPVIFPGSLRENLVMEADLDNITDDDLISAVKKAGGDNLLRALDYDLDSQLFINGDNVLASIEGNYISLARALIKPSNFFIFDDPISSQNQFAKQAFISTLQSLKKHSTVLFATHDQELIKQADKVIILDKGSVAYFGELPNDAPISQEFSNNEK